LPEGFSSTALTALDPMSSPTTALVLRNILWSSPSVFCPAFCAPFDSLRADSPSPTTGDRSPGTGEGQGSKWQPLCHQLSQPIHRIFRGNRRCDADRATVTSERRSQNGTRLTVLSSAVCLLCVRHTRYRLFLWTRYQGRAGSGGGKMVFVPNRETSRSRRASVVYTSFPRLGRRLRRGRIPSIRRRPWPSSHPGDLCSSPAFS
jgi:hypothetical protein